MVHIAMNIVGLAHSQHGVEIGTFGLGVGKHNHLVAVELLQNFLEQRFLLVLGAEEQVLLDVGICLELELTNTGKHSVAFHERIGQ